MADLRLRRKPSRAVFSKESQVTIKYTPDKYSANKFVTWRLLTYDEIPAWHQDNEYIRSGYRPETNSIRPCFASWLYVHNEAANIFTHLIPAIASLICEALLLGYFRVTYPAATHGDRLAFAFFLLAAASCLGMSATYHTLMNHSASISNLWLRLDYVGIVILTLGDFESGIYLVFYCEPILQQVYWIMVSRQYRSQAL